MLFRNTAVNKDYNNKSMVMVDERTFRDSVKDNLGIKVLYSGDYIVYTALEDVVLYVKFNNKHIARFFAKSFRGAFSC